MPGRSRRSGGRAPSGSVSAREGIVWRPSRRTVDESLVENGWPPETRPFRAHLTLARSDGVPAGAEIGARLGAAAADLRIPARIDRIGLFESLTGGGPARYEPLELIELEVAAGGGPTTVGPMVEAPSVLPWLSIGEGPHPP